ncbi:MAG: glycosyltransferase 87 family protein [Actinomycetota bacterium]|nr:glycosyltransferase 87 family protein [Actinomycetota bacterium]
MPTAVAVLAISLLFLMGGFALKAQCLAGFGGREFSHLCYNDIQPLYGIRGVADHTFPYVEGELAGSELTGGAVEYPVLTGVFMWASGLPVSTGNSYLVFSAALLAPFALATTWLLWKMSGLRALMWAAAPAIVLYAFHNWDLLAVAAVAAGLYAWWNGRPWWAAVAFGLGGALKMYPLMFLGPLALEFLALREPRSAIKVTALGAGTWLAANLPFMVANFGGWYATYDFHRQRVANFDTIWHFGWPTWTAEHTNLVTTSLLLGSFALLLALGWFARGRNADAYPFLQTSAALLAAFLLFNKVHSPQYTLWLLPFLAVLRVRVGWWIAYALADLAVYVGVFRWFYDFVYLGLDFTWAKKLLIAGVWSRALLLAALMAVFMTAHEALRDNAAGELSQPVSRVGGVGEQQDDH